MQLYVWGDGTSEKGGKQEMAHKVGMQDGGAVLTCVSNHKGEFLCNRSEVALRVHSVGMKWR
jgi:hypothetical protein